MLSRFVIAFLPRSKHLWISWLQSPFAVILEPKKVESVTVSISPPPMYLPWSDATRFHDLRFLNVKPAFSLFYFTFIKRLFSSSLLSAIKVVSSAYLRLLIAACDSSSPAFHMMYSTYKLNKQGDNIPVTWCTLDTLLSQFCTSVVPCPVLTVPSWPVYRFLSRQVRWSGIPISLRIFHSLLCFIKCASFVVTQSKALA